MMNFRPFNKLIAGKKVLAAIFVLMLCTSLMPSLPVAAQDPYQGTILSGNDEYLNVTTTAGSRSSTITISVRNDGTQTWYNSGANIVAINYRYEPTDTPGDNGNTDSHFGCADWITSYRVSTMNQTSVAPGQTATFNFWMCNEHGASVSSGYWKEHFALAYGGNWMSDGTGDVPKFIAHVDIAQSVYYIRGYVRDSGNIGIPSVSLAFSGGHAPATTNSSGLYQSATEFPNGTYIVTPSKTGCTFSPTSQNVTISGANQTNINFTATCSSSLYSISGYVRDSGNAGISGVSLAFSGGHASATTNSSGLYQSATEFPNGSYTVTPSKTGCTFSPTSQNVTISGANQTNINFTATCSSSLYSISGYVRDSGGVGVSGVSVAFSGGHASATTNSSGLYQSATEFPNGSYTVTPSKSGHTFNPASQNVTINNGSQTNVNFTGAIPTACTPYSIDTNLKQVVSVTGENLDNFIRSQRPNSPLIGLGNTWVEVGNLYEIDAIYLMAHAIHESAWGTSRIAQDKNNIYGYNANDGNPYGDASSYPNKRICIDLVAKKINKNYLTPEGIYYNGATLRGMNVRYATDPNWGNAIVNYMNQAANYIGNTCGGANPPSGGLLWPPSNGYKVGDHALLRAIAQDNSGMGIKRVVFNVTYGQSTVVSQIDYTTPYEYNLDMTGMADGEYGVGVVIEDNQGNRYDMSLTDYRSIIKDTRYLAEHVDQWVVIGGQIQRGDWTTVKPGDVLELRVQKMNASPSTVWLNTGNNAIGLFSADEPAANCTDNSYTNAFDKFKDGFENHYGTYDTGIAYLSESSVSYGQTGNFSARLTVPQLSSGRYVIELALAYGSEWVLARDTGNRCDYLSRVWFGLDIQNPNEIIIPVAAGAYLNQRSLTPSGDSKCGSASAAMVLAMLGVIDKDYNSMARTANAIYPDTVKKGEIYGSLINEQINQHGNGQIVATYKLRNMAWPNWNDYGWSVIKQEINAGRPVIIGTVHGVVTKDGHFIVIVGYSEANATREVIAYDPFGKWLEKSPPYNYALNTTSPTSVQGRRVRYKNFDWFFGESIFIIHPKIAATVVHTSILDNPELIFAEPEMIDTYDGLPIIEIENVLYLPIIIKK